MKAELENLVLQMTLRIFAMITSSELQKFHDGDGFGCDNRFHHQLA